MRYLQIDRIDRFSPFSFAEGRKAITLADEVFEHHFPGQPVYPGALLVESMAQLGGALMELSLRRKGDLSRCVLSRVNAKFRGFVRPGDLLQLRAEVKSHHEESALVRVVIRCDEKVMSEAEILYVYLVMDDPRLEASRVDTLDILTREVEVIGGEEDA